MNSRKFILLLTLTSAMILVAVIGNFYFNNKVQQTVKKGSSSADEVSESETQTEKEPFKINTQKEGTLVYVPVGDSLTGGFFAEKEKDKFTSLLSRKIKETTGDKVTMKSVSSYGGVSSGGLKAIDDINQIKPDLISIEYGTNDCNKENNVSIDTFRKNITQLIEGTSTEVDQKPQYVLVTTWKQQGSCEPFDKEIKDIGEKYSIPVADISDIWKDETTSGPAGKETFLGKSDTFHPNNKGMSLIADRIYNALEETTAR